MKEEKNGSSSHIPNNGHSWGSVGVGKGGGNIIFEVCQRCGTRGSIKQDFLFVSQG
jgi:hypothetical protein